MPEPSQFQFTIQEMAKILIREQGITAGHWELHVTFFSSGAGISMNNGAHYPTIINQVTGIVLQRMPMPTPLSVDAATVAVAEFPENL